MNFKKLISITAIALFIGTALFAHGKKDVEETNASNLNSWQETFDLEGKKKGKYNIMITAKDLGGNTYVEGPHNIVIDPESDKCKPSITNPVPNMRVVGNLNIVGICTDDDGMKNVELLLDNEKTVNAAGGEFWSYYLDTSDLEEGPHTIEVIGYDINGLEGNHTSLTWQLDRRQPVTAVKEKDMVTDKAMGVLVSGNVHFQGTVEDGNGIKSLAYSLDNGEHFRDCKIKINDKKKNAEFDVVVNTKEYPDGPTVLWFKAVDNSGSTGIYSFLYFIDNTKPDVKIISPLKDQKVNGKFSVAGLAKDALGIKSLEWTYGKQSGAIELIPGNPYWCLDFDTTNGKEKSEKFTITAIDAADNKVTVGETILLDQEADKPVVTISEPVAAGELSTGDLYIRGSVTDDDGVSGVYISLDGGEPVYQETKGVFYYNFGDVAEYSYGKHKFTVIAEDINCAFDEEGAPVIDDEGRQVHLVKSNPTTVEFFTLGKAPDFTDATVSFGKEKLPFVNGMAIHPEGNSAFEVNIDCGAGIKNVTTEYWLNNKQHVELSNVTLKSDKKYTAKIPVTPSLPMGVVYFRVSATDAYDRLTDFTGMFYVENTTVIKQDEPAVVFDDSTIVVENGKGLVDLTKNNAEFPATGYLIGDKIAKVELVPETKFATVKNNGNQITLVPGKELGASEEVVVRVTTAKGDTFDSIPLIFSNDKEIPSVTAKVNGSTDIYYFQPGPTYETDEEGNEIEIPATPVPIPEVTITGKASCKTGINTVKYTVMSVPVEMAKGIIGKINPIVVSETQNVQLDDEGNYSINISAANYEDGVHLVEITAVSKAGITKTTSVLLTKIAPLPEPDAKGKVPAPKAPVVVWLDHCDVYAVGVYQERLETVYETFARDTMAEGSNALTWTAVPLDEEGTPGKGVAGKYTANKDFSLDAHFATVAHQGQKSEEAPDTYRSGMNVTLAYGTDKSVIPGNVTVLIDTGAPVSGVTYEIEGAEVAGGDVKQSGSAKLTKPVVVKGEEQVGPARWTAEIPLKNLPARVTKIKVNIKAGTMTKTIEGTVNIIRPETEIGKDDKEEIYEMPSQDMKVDGNQFAFGPDSKYYYYANYPAPISVELVNGEDGLEVSTDGNLVILSATKDGYYKDVKIKVTDILHDVHESKVHNFVVDSNPPELIVENPVYRQNLGNSVKLMGTAADVLGVKSLEYSMDAGATWLNLPMTSNDAGNLGVTFSKDLDISKMPDGLISIDVRATDISGNVSVVHIASFKDVTPPEVSIVLPLAEDIVNGLTLIVFDAKDNGTLSKVEYFTPGLNPDDEAAASTNIPLKPLVSTLVGSEQNPIDDKMSFVFTDDAGNRTKLNAWQFLIDNESDLPRSEIHLPEENQVITRDFVISGVIYDDDGASTIYYKLDDGEFIQFPETNTSFSIPVALSTMTDNEHTVTVYAVDANGVKGYEVSRNFRVSLEEPKSVLVEPDMDSSVRGNITLRGWSSDENGIQSVKVSLDNGNSYNDAVLEFVEGSDADWVYTFDSRVINGGSQVVFLKTTDNYGIEGLYSSLINVDNSAPVLSLEMPKDESSTTGQLFFSGFAYDNLKITDMYVTIRNLEKSTEPFVTKFPIERVIGKSIDIRNLDDGFYNVELTAVDAAGNSSNVSRNIHLDKKRAEAVVDILYPMNGEHKTGEFNIYGQAEAEGKITLMNLFIDDKFIAETTLTDAGFFRFPMNRELLGEGKHSYRVEAILETGSKISSPTQTITYSVNGPWITLDNFVYGTFATNRPIIRGRAGYTIDEDELAYSKTKEAPIALKEEIAGKVVTKVELSMDNGRTFIPLSKNGKWQYRVENTDWKEGMHYLLLRATMKNGEVAIERTVIQIDNTRPSVHVISPEIGGTYNQQLEFSGLSGDNVGLESVTLTFRKGDKSSYEVPEFIQGLYLDAHFWGATLFDVGAGLTFFDDNVKLQFQWGQFTQAQRDMISTLFHQEKTEMRYGGNVFGIKLLANISSIPFAYFFGHDFDWLSAGIAVGANFSYFMETNSGVPQILSSALLQLEFPKITMSQRKAFSAFSAYTEGSLWFIPTDVQSNGTENAPAKIVPQISVGIRVNVF